MFKNCKLHLLFLQPCFHPSSQRSLPNFHNKKNNRPACFPFKLMFKPTKLCPVSGTLLPMIHSKKLVHLFSLYIPGLF